MFTKRSISMMALCVVLAAITATPAAAQKAKKAFSVSADLALEATKTALVDDGYDVVRLEPQDDLIIVHYRRGNMGKGKGKGPMERMVIRRQRNTVVIEEAEPTILLKIQVALDL